MKSEPTPGDWHFRRGRIEAGEPVETQRGTCTTVVAVLHGTALATFKANGNLLAASKRLLEACERLLRAEREGWNIAKMDHPPIADIEAAIALAKGGKT